MSFPEILKSKTIRKKLIQQRKIAVKVRKFEDLKLQMDMYGLNVLRIAKYGRQDNGHFYLGSRRVINSGEAQNKSNQTDI